MQNTINTLKHFVLQKQNVAIKQTHNILLMHHASGKNKACLTSSIKKKSEPSFHAQYFPALTNRALPDAGTYSPATRLHCWPAALTGNTLLQTI